MTRDEQVRTAAFSFLEAQTGIHGEVLAYTLLQQGFQFEGRRVPLIAPQGIFIPAVLGEMALSFYTAPPKRNAPAPYHDELGPDGMIRYRYRGTDPFHRDNVGMRLAMQRQAPLVYLFGIVPGEYLPIWPVYIVNDDPVRLTFTVAVDDRRFGTPEIAAFEDDMRRAYVSRVVMQRLHQRSFRDRVLRAYRARCAVCRLAHAELLDAAHILPDGHPQGSPIVPNGLALCKLHHAAFDQHILGINPNYVIEIRPDILEEIDGPMLQHGLKEMAGQRLAVVPGSSLDKPRREFLEERFALFQKAG